MDGFTGWGVGFGVVFMLLFWLAALGLDAPRAMGAVRLSTGWTTTMQEIERAADALIAAWRSLAPK